MVKDPRMIGRGLRAGLALGLVSALLIACGAARSGGARNPNLITTDELRALNVSNAYEAVERLRPMFLRTRGVQSATAEAQLPVVYIDGIRQGGPEVMRTLPLTDVQEIRYISAADATTRYGTNHTGGAIEIRIRS